MVEHFSILDPAPNFLGKSHCMVDTLNFSSESEVKALLKIVGKITEQEPKIIWKKFDDIAHGFKRCDKC